MEKKPNESEKIEVRIFIDEKKDKDLFIKFKEVLDYYSPMNKNQVGKLLLDRGINYWFKDEKRKK